MNADRSSSRNTSQIRARTLALYHVANPELQEGGRLNGTDAGTLLARQAGQIAYTTVRLGAPNVVTDCCRTITCTEGSITNIVGSIFSPSDPIGGVTYGLGLAVSWDPIPNGSIYLITQVGVTPQTFEFTSATSANFYTNTSDDVILYAHVNGCPDISGSTPGPCFLAGALVTMADGSEKAIENVRVGDIVLGAFGEHNTVLALHRPLLGLNTMSAINGDHHTSSHHPHVSVDKKFYAVKPAVVMATTYGQYHQVLDEHGFPSSRFLHGLKQGRVGELTLGIELKTVEGSRSVSSLDTYAMPSDTQLYNLVLSGSHTYYVDGYAVTGWPREDDFDYDAWIRV